MSSLGVQVFDRSKISDSRVHDSGHGRPIREPDPALIELTSSECGEDLALRTNVGLIRR